MSRLNVDGLKFDDHVAFENLQDLSASIMKSLLGKKPFENFADRGFNSCISKGTSQTKTGCQNL